MTDIRTVLKQENEDLRATIATLTAFNESMQTDARKNTETIRAQAAEIARLTEKVRYAYVQIEALERVK